MSEQNEETAPSVTIGGITATLVRPSWLARQALGKTVDEIEVGGDGLILALGAAALRECWPENVKWPTTHMPRKWKAGQQIERLGHEIFDALCEVADEEAVVKVCFAALRFARRRKDTNNSDFQAAKDFSEAPAGA